MSATGVLTKPAAVILQEPAALPDAPAERPALEAVGLTKIFGGVTVLDDVSLRLPVGSFHALLGENGAGKSTLVKCIMGYYRADAGHVLVRGSETKIKNPREAAAQGIGMVYQHFTLVDNMSVAENLVLSRRQQPFFFDWTAERAAVSAFMRGMPFRLDPDKPVRTLAAGEKQKLEILKQLYLGSSVIILDEPTSVLTPDEADEVLGLLRSMTHQGKVTVLMISHKFREVTKFADEVTILRRGKLVGRGRVGEMSTDGMARLMVGDDPAKSDRQRVEAEPGRLVLEVRGLSADDDLGAPAVRELSLQVRAGEIVGIAGVSGNGQEELVEVLAGQRLASAGAVHVAETPFRARRAEMRAQKVRCLPDEPLKNACVAGMSVAENIGFRHYDRSPFARLRALVSGRRLRHHARKMIKEYGIRTQGPDAPIGSLSGGNVQRAVLARELHDEVALLIAANPCFGLDFAAVAEIRGRIMDARNRGTAVLLISADLDEIFTLADRVLVISEGKIVHEATAANADIGVIGRHMAGHA
ncbi:MAG TPA: ABC transporter ATP-binding protein [Polyangia bacterium]|jgi:simple sugar transport system ATP-binding protein|nr:ABC transporter ATP-binding protein [Polyangia bacterium]